jgi:MFS family permease
LLHLLQRRPYRLILSANFISLFGSGLNHASIIWFVLDRTHSEKSVALLVSTITLPSLFLLPLSGVLIDRLDRRYITMVLDGARGLAVMCVAILALSGHIALWHVYAMGVVLGLGAFMFWPNMAALTQELVEPADMVPLNALVTSTAQGGWMIAGAAVGFLYQRIGLGGVLFLDASTYVISVLLMLPLRKGKHLVHDETAPLTASHFNRDFIAGLRYVGSEGRVMILGMIAAMFMAAMMSQNVLTAPFSLKILNAGAPGFGFCNAGWSLGAIASSALVGTFMRSGSGQLWVLAASLILAALSCGLAPHFAILAVGVALYFVMGAGRGMAGVGVNSALMQVVPKQLMGRTQNVINFIGILMQLMLTMGVGWLAEHVTLIAGFYAVASFYFIAGLLALIVARSSGPIVPPDLRAIIEPLTPALEGAAEF